MLGGVYPPNNCNISQLQSKGWVPTFFAGHGTFPLFELSVPFPPEMEDQDFLLLGGPMRKFLSPTDCLTILVEFRSKFQGVSPK